jgi:hypothetical protein
MASPQKRPTSGGSNRGSGSGSTKSAAPKSAAKSRSARPDERQQSGSASSKRIGKTVQEETEIGEDYESGRRDALP